MDEGDYRAFADCFVEYEERRMKREKPIQLQFQSKA